MRIMEARSLRICSADKVDSCITTIFYILAHSPYTPLLGMIKSTHF